MTGCSKTDFCIVTIIYKAKHVSVCPSPIPNGGLDSAARNPPFALQKKEKKETSVALKARCQKGGEYSSIVPLVTLFF